MNKLPKLPALIDRKIYKTGQTRGADDDEIFQNRVGRNSTVLIPFHQFEKYCRDEIYSLDYDNGYIVLISPKDFFDEANSNIIKKYHLILGENLLIFYETRDDWNKYNPDKIGYVVANSRKSPLNGHYVARIPATTSLEGGEKINRGFTTTNLKGVGIRAYEYASSENIRKARLQLEAIFWHCHDAEEVVQENGMSAIDAQERKNYILSSAVEQSLLDYKKLSNMRILNKRKMAICPLCLEILSARGFFNKVLQAEGREVVDLTVTQLNLFHIHELRYGDFNHMPYNLGWGHHFCNIVVKDSGIANTLQWMVDVLRKNNFSIN